MSAHLLPELMDIERVDHQNARRRLIARARRRYERGRVGATAVAASHDIAAHDASRASLPSASPNSKPKSTKYLTAQFGHRKAM